jgi:hypothetical protein
MARQVDKSGRDFFLTCRNLTPLQEAESGSEAAGTLQVSDQTRGKGTGIFLSTISLEETKLTRLSSNLYQLHAISLVTSVPLF